MTAAAALHIETTIDIVLRRTNRKWLGIVQIDGREVYRTCDYYDTKEGALERADQRLSGIFCKEFTKELERRGYDVETIRFSVKPKVGNQRFASQRSNPTEQWTGGKP